jgi:hypothetical protein
MTADASGAGDAQGNGELTMARHTDMPAPEADVIVATILHWYDDLIGHVMTGEAARAIIRADIVRRLHGGTLAIDWVIEAAEGGHADADEALRKLVDEAINQDRFQALPVQLRNYSRQPSGGRPRPTRAARTSSMF